MISVMFMSGNGAQTPNDQGERGENEAHELREIGGGGEHGDQAVGAWMRGVKIGICSCSKIWRMVSSN